MRPLSDVDFAAERAANGSTPLFDAAQAYLDDAAEPAGPHVLVHGDFWQGNMMLRDDEVVGVVDWDAAGLGPPGVDLGSLRCDVAMYFGIEAVDAVHAGWIEATGGPLDNLAHWDVVAASSTPVDLSSWMPVITGQGRPDVDLATVTARRNEFLKAALDGVSRR